MMRSILAFVCVAATWLTSAAALACGSVPPSYFTIAAIKPADGTTGFPLDGAVRVELVDTWVYDVDGTYQPNTRITVTRIDTDEVVPGTIGGFGVGYNPMWLPDESLAANTQYRIDVVTADELRTDVEGPITGSSTFTTGASLSPPIAFEGAMRVAGVRIGTAEQCTNTASDCGGCAPSGRREISVAYVDVDLPSVTGGFAAYGYAASVSMIVDGEPFLGAYWNLARSEAGWPQVVSEVPARWTGLLPPLGHPYEPCFELSVIDGTQREQKASACLDEEVDVEALLQPDAGAREASERDESSDAGTVARTTRAHADAGSAVPDDASSSVASAHERTTIGDESGSGQADCSVTLIDRTRSPWPAFSIALAWLGLRLRRRKRVWQGLNVRAMLAFACAVATWVTTAVALACGTAAPSYSTIKSIGPGDGTMGFPLDGMVRVDLVEHWVDANGGKYPQPFHLTVTRVDSGEVVPGTIAGAGGTSPTWQPDELLSANTQYRVEVSTVDELESDFDGPVTGSSTFTTGGAPSPPIAFDGELTIASVRRDTAPHCVRDSCYRYCTPDGPKVQVVLVDLHAPEVSGGFPDYGYSSVVTTTIDGEPIDRGYPGVDNKPKSGLLPDGEPSWSVLLPPLGHPYAPCFELYVIDALAHDRSTSVCLGQKIDVEKLLRSAPGVVDIDIATDAGTAAPDGRNGSQADAPPSTVADDYSRKADCSAAPTGGSRAPVLAVPAALSWLALRARRRKRTLQA